MTRRMKAETAASAHMRSGRRKEINEKTSKMFLKPVNLRPQNKEDSRVAKKIN